MADIVLFRPIASRQPSRRCPLGLVYIAAPLANRGFEIKIIDEEVSPDWRNDLNKHLSSSTICVGVSVMTGHSIESALNFSKAVKEIACIPIV